MIAGNTIDGWSDRYLHKTDELMGFCSIMISVEGREEEVRIREISMLL
jgi:hypothetical protein